MDQMEWEALPPGRVAAIEKITGPIMKAEPVTRGLAPGLAAVVCAREGRYFAKAVPRDHPACGLYEREAAASAALPPGIPAPPLLYASRAGGWLILLFGYADGREADLAPGSPDLPGVAAVLRAISAAPAPRAVPAADVNVAALLDVGAALLAGEPDSLPWRMYVAAARGLDPDALASDRLVHYDLHPGNLRAAPRGTVTAVDWAYACAGAPWLDAAMIVPRLIAAGHPPDGAEHVVSALPAWQDAPPAVVTGLAAFWTMFREHKALYGPHQQRPMRERATRAGRAWISYRMS